MTEPDPPAESEPGDLPVGTRVGEYQIDRLLGRGGMGVVYAAAQPEIGAWVAVKVLAAQFSAQPRLVKRFVDEARAVNKIRHPNIIDIFSFGRLPDGRQYFVMEYLQGETLSTRLERGPLPLPEAKRLLVQICEALQAAHIEQIIHRDLKPDNLWIAIPKHGEPYAKILDFGIAKLVEDRGANQSTEAGVAMGTAHYMSPEQCRGEGVDHRTDIYAMGVILYRMFAGRLPFAGTSFIEVLTQQITATPSSPAVHAPVPLAMEQLILACLEKDPARRPQSAQALGAAIALALGDLPAGAAATAGRQDATLVRGARVDPTIVRPATAAPAIAGTQGGIEIERDSLPRRKSKSLGIVAAVVLVLAGTGSWVAWRMGQTPVVPTATTAVPPPAPAAVVTPAPAPLPAETPAVVAKADAAIAGSKTAVAAPTEPAARPPSGRSKKPQPATPPGKSSKAKDQGFSTENPYR
jgi:eukaryotic-like serine/threonine-protein kinase